MLKTSYNYILISLMLLVLPFVMWAKPEEEEDPEIDVPLTEVESDEPYIYEG